MTMPAVQDPPEGSTKPAETTPPTGEGTPGPDKGPHADAKDSKTEGTPAPGPDKGDEGDKGAEGANAVPKHILEAIEAGVEKWKAENLDNEVQSRLDAKRQEDVETATEGQVTKQFTDTLKAVGDGLKAISFETEDADGKPVRFQLTDDQIQKVVHEPLRQMRGNVRNIEEAVIYDELANEASKLLGSEEKVTAFAKEAAGKPISEWLKAVVEHAAPTSAWAKKQAIDHEAAKTAEYARGWEEREGAPPGQPSMKDSKNPAAGKITEARWSGMSREERADAWRDRPAEVREMLGQT